MKLCCGNGKPYDSLTEAERIGGCNNDHCTRPVEVVTINPEDIPIVEGLDLSGYTIYEGEKE